MERKSNKDLQVTFLKYTFILIYVYFTSLLGIKMSVIVALPGL